MIDKIKKILERMTLEDKVGQLLNFDFSRNYSAEYIEEIVKKTKPGSFFVVGDSPDKTKMYADIINKYTCVPVIVSSDIECGVGKECDGELLPHQLAWGACDDENLLEKAGEAVGNLARRNGLHWTFSPVVDIIYNANNPLTNVRAVSSSPNQVIKMTSAYTNGIQKNGLMVAGCKHFPGDGVDDRNQHFCTTINSLSKDKWMKTYGKVYKALIQAGTSSIMVGHIACPAFQQDDENEYDEILGFKPATLSYALMTKLLKGRLKFKGCIVSDAMSMIGACAMVPLNRLAIEFIKNGGDIMLFALPTDYDYLLEAVKSKEIPMERIDDAVTRVLALKFKARIFDNQEEVMSQTKSFDMVAISDEIADKSIKIVRNSQNLIPLNIEPNSKILMINIEKVQEVPEAVNSLMEIKTQLEKRGFIVEMLSNPKHSKVKAIKNNFDVILINLKMSCQDYPGGSLRAGWPQYMPLWRGYALDHPKVIFTSFGDPFKIYEYPFAKTYINAFSNVDSSQRAFVKVLFGEIQVSAKNPVGLKDYFDCEV